MLLMMVVALVLFAKMGRHSQFAATRMQESIDYNAPGMKNCARVLPEHGRVCSVQDDGIAIDSVSLDPIDYDGDINYIFPGTYNCVSRDTYSRLDPKKNPLNPGMQIQCGQPLDSYPCIKQDLANLARNRRRHILARRPPPVEDPLANIIARRRQAMMIEGSDEGSDDDWE